MNNFYASLAAAVIGLALGGWFGIEWQQGREALAREDMQAELDRLTAQGNDIALIHANNTAALSAQLGNTRAKLNSLTTGRDCLSADAVRLLNSAPAGVPAAAPEPASAPAAAATDRDVGDALAICRGEYSKLAGQMNAILDIEDARDLRR